MCQPLFRADGDNRLALWVEIHIKLGTVPVGDGATQTRNAPRHRVAVGIRALGGLGQLIHNMLRRGLVRITHTKINNILAPLSRLRLQLIDDVEYVGGQAFDSLKIFDQNSYSSARKSLTNK